MLHAGYILASVLLLIAVVLPPKCANAGLAETTSDTGAKQPKYADKKDVESATDVGATPPVMSTL